MNVQPIPTRTTITVPIFKDKPAINEQVTFTAKLERKSTGLGISYWFPIPWESTPQLKIVHYANGVMVTDVAKTTDGNGKITWTTSWPSTGEQTYYAYFEGDTTYAKSLSAGQTVSPTAKTSITCGIGPGISVPKGEPVIIWGTLRDSSGHGLANKEVYIVGDVNAKLITDASGNFSMIGGISRGTCFLCYIFVHSEFHGDGNYLASESAGYGVIA